MERPRAGARGLAGARTSRRRATASGPGSRGGERRGSPPRLQHRTAPGWTPRGRRRPTGDLVDELQHWLNTPARSANRSALPWCVRARTSFGSCTFPSKSQEPASSPRTRRRRRREVRQTAARRRGRGCRPSAADGEGVPRHRPPRRDGSTRRARRARDGLRVDRAAVASNSRTRRRRPRRRRRTKRALTSLWRIPAMKSSPAITASLGPAGRRGGVGSTLRRSNGRTQGREFLTEEPRAFGSRLSGVLPFRGVAV